MRLSGNFKTSLQRGGLPYEEFPEKYEDIELVYTMRRTPAKEVFTVKKNITGLELEEIADYMKWNSFFGRDIGIDTVTVYID